jgi:hypothetical protein
VVDPPVLTIQVLLRGDGSYLALFEANAAGQPSWGCGYVAKTPLAAVERGLGAIKKIADRGGKRGRYPRGYQVMRHLV